MDILDISATKSRNKQIVSKFISTYRRKKRGFGPEQIGGYPQILDNPGRLRFPKHNMKIITGKYNG